MIYWRTALSIFLVEKEAKNFVRLRITDASNQ